MRPIEQPTVGEGTGTCIAASVASIFEVPISACAIMMPPDNYSQKVYEWTRECYPGLRCVHRTYATNYRIVDHDEGRWDYDLDEVEIPWFPGYWMGTFESPRITASSGPYKGKPGLHCVVMKNRELVWDPHPQRDMGVGKFFGEYVWYVEDPSKL
jgi:hypothetical protein